MPRWWIRARISYGGAVVGLIFFCLSLTPSLLPRGYVLEGILTGLATATGYGLGVALAHLHRKLPARYRMRPSTAFKQWTLGILAVLCVVFLILGAHWQSQIRVLVEAQPNSGDYLVRVILVAAIVVVLFVMAGRSIRRIGRWFGRKLGGHVPPKLAFYGGGVLAALFVYFLISGVVGNTLAGLLNGGFSLKNGGTPEGIYQPQDPMFAGSPASNIDWNTLGRPGREFVGQTPTMADIERWTGAGKAKAPSRLYVGLESAPTLDERVALLIKELDRTKAADRTAVLIAIPTGSGGIDGAAVRSVEYLYGGDVTTMGIQYSYLPSWLSFLADQQKVRDTGKAIVNAVYDWWSKLDPAHRPHLLLYGESLGTLGADGAFSGPGDMHERMYGVLLAGPPNSNGLWTDIVAHRDAGTRQVLPVYQNGAVVRFSDGSDPFADPTGQPWESNRVGFLQHASDPVVWAGTSLWLHKPDWLREPRGSDVMPNMRWYPFVSFFQVGLDLPFAFSATPGHGHRYDTQLVSAWASVLNIPLDSSQQAQLEKLVVP